MGMHLTGVHFIDVCLTGVHLTGYASWGRKFMACFSNDALGAFFGASPLPGAMISEEGTMYSCGRGVNNAGNCDSAPVSPRNMKLDYASA
jgi:hypothetical protein